MWQVHINRRSQGVGADYQGLLTKFQLWCSMSRVGKYYGNAPKEDFYDRVDASRQKE
jgi:transposase InsO family protein